MIIEDASELQQETTDRLLALMKELQGDIAVIVEISEKDVNRFFQECPIFTGLIENRIYLS